MAPHPTFPLLELSSDDDLAAQLGSAVSARHTIHEWPLSCVQRLELADGRRLVYKCQLQPTVEPQFYERATSALLPGHRLLPAAGAAQSMVVDWIDAPRLRELAPSERELVRHGRRLVAEIGEIAGDPPVDIDLGAPDAWLREIDWTFGRLRELSSHGRFRRIAAGDVERARAWASSSNAIAAATTGARLIHGDLTADQVFLADDGYRVVDWQRPLLGPPEVDLVGLLVGPIGTRSTIDPRRHVDVEVVRVFWCIRLHWAIRAQTELFPGFPGPLFEQWAVEALAGLA